MVTMKDLLEILPQRGEVQWIAVRPARRAPMEMTDAVQATMAEGLVGDRYGGRSGNRQVTLIQHEHLAAIASCVGSDAIDPASLRRNLVVSGINLLALKGKRFHIGSAELETTSVCAPCSFMEKALGPGGYNAMRGHGGICARVLKNGIIRLGDAVSVAND